MAEAAALEISALSVSPPLCGKPKLSDAVSFYCSRAAGLGLEFYQRIEAAEDEIIAHHEARKNVGGPCGPSKAAKLTVLAWRLFLSTAGADETAVGRTGRWGYG